MGDYNNGVPCKRQTVREEGCRSFHGCSDPAIKAVHFKEDTWTYRHTCTAYEPTEEDQL